MRGQRRSKAPSPNAGAAMPATMRKPSVGVVFDPAALATLHSGDYDEATSSGRTRVACGMSTVGKGNAVHRQLGSALLGVHHRGVGLHGPPIAPQGGVGAVREDEGALGGAIVQAEPILLAGLENRLHQEVVLRLRGRGRSCSRVDPSALGYAVAALTSRRDRVVNPFKITMLLGPRTDSGSSPNRHPVGQTIWRIHPQPARIHSAPTPRRPAMSDGSTQLHAGSTPHRPPVYPREAPDS